METCATPNCRAHRPSVIFSPGAILPARISSRSFVARLSFSRLRVAEFTSPERLCTCFSRNESRFFVTSSGINSRLSSQRIAGPIIHCNFLVFNSAHLDGFSRLPCEQKAGEGPLSPHERSEDDAKTY